jgi:hypothetical protein
MKISRKWLKIAPLYYFFCPENYRSKADWGAQAAAEAYTWESQGQGSKAGLFDTGLNGYILGKKWMDATIGMWKEGLKERTLFKPELYAMLGQRWHWWLDRVLPTVQLDPPQMQAEMVQIYRLVRGGR